MENRTYTIRKMNHDEVKIAIEWAAKEGWNPGLYDAGCFYKVDPSGFFIGLLNGEPIATMSAVVYDDTYGFGGFYIVKPKYRGKGYGMKLFSKAWEYLGDRNKGGDGVVENLEIYKRVGLELAHYSFRYQTYGTDSGYMGDNIVKLSKAPFDKLAMYDDFVFGFKRHNFLKCWISQPESAGLSLVRDGKILGYGVIRKCFKGYKIGPLFANDAYVAEELFKSLVGGVEKNEEVFLDIPEVNKAAIIIAKKYEMKKVFTVGRVYTKGQPDFPLEKWFGVTTFELG